MEPGPSHDEVAFREIARRTTSATFGIALVFAVTELLIPGATGIPGSVLSPILVAIVAARIVAHRRCVTEPSWRRNWVLLSVVVVATNLFWGILVAFALAAGNPGLPAVAYAFILCGFGVAALTSLAPAPWLQRVVLAVLMVPPIVSSSTGHGEPAFVALELVFLAYCLVAGALQSRTFWEMVAATDQVRAHAEAQRRANDQLHAEISRRLEVEVELRQAQKLEAVGRLAAGIAHEINTPLQFIADSCTFLGEGAGELAAGVAEYRDLVRALAEERVTAAEALAQLARVEAERDLAYLAEHLAEASERSLRGLERVGRIVRATEDFARPSPAKTAGNLNAAIESTLVVCRNETAQVADVVTELGTLPPVMYHAGELNQVLLALLLNAADAIGGVAASSDRRGTIGIKTWDDGDGWVRVAVSDTGTGIAPELLDKIFEPFFTTKPVGKGSGQGLAIARSIVVGKHGGTLEVSSRLGAGTTVTLALPA